jgi:serine/threonine-protein kinase
MPAPLRASLSNYRILRQIGKGGMAEVYLARKTADQSTSVANEKLVALKRILPHFAEDARVQELLLEEARLGAGFNHPHLVEAYDVGIDGDACFFTMEWVRGHELRYIVRQLGSERRSLSLADTLTVVAGVASGLHYAHNLRSSDGIPLGVVHLDVCPSNVLVTHEGYVKLIDFGVAQTVRNTAVRADDSYAGMVPAPGAATVRRGTLAYMSPEQVLGQPIDLRSDVFSLGIMLWEMTMWRRLFRSDNHAELVHRIVSGDVPPPSSLRPDYPTWLEHIVMKALARSPHDRYESAMDLRLALEDFAFEFSLPLADAPLGELVSGLFPPVSEPREGQTPVPVSPAQARTATPAPMRPATPVPATPTPAPASVDPVSIDPAAPTRVRASNPLRGRPGTPDPLPGAGPGSLADEFGARNEDAEALARRFQNIGTRWRR